MTGSVKRAGGLAAAAIVSTLACDVERGCNVNAMVTVRVGRWKYHNECWCERASAVTSFRCRHLAP